VPEPVCEAYARINEALADVVALAELLQDGDVEQDSVRETLELPDMDAEVDKDEVIDCVALALADTDDDADEESPKLSDVNAVTVTEGDAD